MLITFINLHVYYVFNLFKHPKSQQIIVHYYNVRIIRMIRREKSKSTSNDYNENIKILSQ